MQDYRYILEQLYKFRGKKSGKNWLLYITELEVNSPQEKYVEVQPYLILIKLKSFLFSKMNKMISSSIIRKYIEDAIHNYDEFYMGNIENILYIIECLSDDENYKESILFRELKRIFNFS